MHAPGRAAALAADAVPRQPIRITFDTSALAGSDLSTVQQTFLTSSLLPALKTRLASMINVRAALVVEWPHAGHDWHTNTDRERTEARNGVFLAPHHAHANTRH